MIPVDARPGSAPDPRRPAVTESADTEPAVAEPGGPLGRRDELAAVTAFVDSLASGPRAFAIVGESGMGKTTLFSEALAMARSRKIDVLFARPSRAELGMPIVALADLLEPFVELVIDEIPGPQQDAISIALLRERGGQWRVDRRTLASAVLSIVRQLARRLPVMIAIDDAQWLDRTSSGLLAYALRRLNHERVGILTTEQVHEGAPAEIREAMHALGGVRMTLGPLGVWDINRLVRDRLGIALPRPVTEHIARASYGNPSYALGLADAWHGQPAGDPATPMPLPASLFHELESRLARLPARSLPALLELALADGRGRPALDSAALAVAEDAGIVVSLPGQVRFTHPVWADVVREHATAAERRRVHRALGEAAIDEEDRVRHLAAATERPDALLATEAHAAAALAYRRGAIVEAAEIADMAIALCPPSASSVLNDFRLTAGRYWFHAGDLASARRLAETVLTSGSGQPVHGQALALLACLGSRQSSLAEASHIALDAAKELGGFAAARGDAELDLAYYTVNRGDLAGGIQHARAGQRALRGRAAGDQRGDAIACRVMTEFLAGRGVDEERLQRALKLENPDLAPTRVTRPAYIAALLRLYGGEAAAAATDLASLCKGIAPGGRQAPPAALAMFHVWALVWAGRLEEAKTVASAAAESAALDGDPASLGFASTAHALANAFGADPGTAYAEACRGAAYFRGLESPMGEIFPCWAGGLAAMTAGDAAKAQGMLAEPARRLLVSDDGDPVLALFVPEYVEALIVLGEPTRAEPFLEWFTRRSQALDRAPFLAAAGRCRAMLLAARGDLPGAFAAADEALRQHERCDLPLETARTRLVAGRIARRTAHRRQSRDLLAAAIRTFDFAGATIWADRGRAELRRVGGTPPASEPLSVTEHLVAELAAQGLSNRRIAELTFLSTKTVEANLTRTYRKLRIRSRGGLARALESVAIPADANRPA